MVYESDLPFVTTLAFIMWGIYMAVIFRTERKATKLARTDIIGIPPRTHLKIVVRHQSMWAVWTGIDDMQVPYQKWRGTYIALYDNGTAYACTVQPDGTEDIMRIK